MVFVVNATPVPRIGYRIGVPESGNYDEVLNTDAEVYSGSNIGNQGGVASRDAGWHGQPFSIEVNLPPLATLGFRHRKEDRGREGGPRTAVLHLEKP